MRLSLAGRAFGLALTLIALASCGSVASAPASSSALPASPAGYAAPHALSPNVQPDFIWADTWTATITEGSYNFSATAVFSSRAHATIAYGAPFNCSGKWLYISHNGNVYTYHEHITHQGGLHCIDDNFTLTIVDANTLAYDYGGGQATGTYTRQ